MNELVRLTTQDVGKGIPITDSLIVAEGFKKTHNSVLRDIRNLEKELKESLSKEELALYSFGQSNYKNSQNKDMPFYYMSEEFFIMLVMGYRTKEAYKMKHKFIEAFLFLKKELKARKETRHIGVSFRKSLTETIKNCVTDEGNFKKFAYSNYSKLVYKKITGKTVKKIKEERNIPENKNVRDYFSIDELEKIQELESKIANFIEFSDTINKNDKEIYEMVKKHLELK